MLTKHILLCILLCPTLCHYYMVGCFYNPCVFTCRFWMTQVETASLKIHILLCEYTKRWRRWPSVSHICNVWWTLVVSFVHMHMSWWLVITILWWKHHGHFFKNMHIYKDVSRLLIWKSVFTGFLDAHTCIVVSTKKLGVHEMYNIYYIQTNTIIVQTYNQHWHILVPRNHCTKYKVKERKVSRKCAIGLIPPTRVLSSCESLTVSTDAPKKDEGATVLHYTRSKEQNELLGLSEVSSVAIGFVCSLLASVYI